jgi:hypothetical protein
VINKQFKYKITVFWDITPCSPMKVNLRFGGTRRHNLQGQKNKPSKTPMWQAKPCPVGVYQLFRRTRCLRRQDSRVGRQACEKVQTVFAGIPVKPVGAEVPPSHALCLLSPYCSLDFLCRSWRRHVSPKCETTVTPHSTVIFVDAIVRTSDITDTNTGHLLTELPLRPLPHMLVQYAPKYTVLKLAHLERACAFIDGA